MRVCADCVKFGRVIPSPAAASAEGPRAIAQRLKASKTRMTERRIPLENEEELVEDFGERVRKAREAKRVTLDDLARAVNEKKSLLAKVEAGSFFPDPTVTAKLEAALGIKLREKVSAVHTQKPRASGGMTIGDLLKMQKE